MNRPRRMLGCLLPWIIKIVVDGCGRSWPDASFPPQILSFVQDRCSLRWNEVGLKLKTGCTEYMCETAEAAGVAHFNSALYRYAHSTSLSSHSSLLVNHTSDPQAAFAFREKRCACRREGLLYLLSLSSDLCAPPIHDHCIGLFQASILARLDILRLDFV